jgi:hypothetical protein
VDILGLIAHARRNVVGKVNKNKKKSRGLLRFKNGGGVCCASWQPVYGSCHAHQSRTGKTHEEALRRKDLSTTPYISLNQVFFFCITQFASICTPWVDVPCTNAHGNLIKLVTQPMTTYQAPALPWEFGACTKYLKRDTEQQRRPIMSVVHCAGNYSNHCQRLSFLAIHIQDQRFKHGQLLMLPNHPWSSFHPEP